MDRLFYFDTSIWLDLLENRGINGPSANQLISSIIIQKDHIFVSDINLNELKRQGYSIIDLQEMLRLFKSPRFQWIHTYRYQTEEARSIAKRRNIPNGDALHAILARDNHLIFISRDQDFEKLKDITMTYFPEDFI